MSSTMLGELKAIYKAGKLVPFIGAGLSAPFKIPTWGELIEEYADTVDFGIVEAVRQMISFEVREYNYWQALHYIKRYGHRTDRDIQEFIMRKINSILNNYESIAGSVDNNFTDIAGLNSNLYLTTNYDDLLEKAMAHKCFAYELREYDNSTQKLFLPDNRIVFHLHGLYNKVANIVITEEIYKELYKAEKYKNLFSLLAGGYTFLFLGFSFDDIFIRNIIKDLNEYFNTKHFILLNNPDTKKVEEIKKDYNIETIPYDISESTHTTEIRKIIQYLKCDNESDSEIDNEIEYVIEILLEKLPNKKDKEMLEDRLFCKKLRIEKVSDNNVDFSKNCYWLAEQYIQWLGKTKIKRRKDVIEFILNMCMLKHQELFSTVYEAYGDSEKFLGAVHEALEKLDISKVETLVSKQGMPNSISRKGFIHFLADTDTSENEIWWGKERKI